MFYVSDREMKSIENVIFSNPRSSFEIFKSNICHLVKDMETKNFISFVEENDTILKLVRMNRIAEALYILAMLDYLSRINSLPISDKYDSLRSIKFDSPLFPSSIKFLSTLDSSDFLLKKATEESIPEFSRHNIIEYEIDNVF